MEAIQLELLQLFFDAFSEHCNLAHSNAEHSHAYPQISTLTEIVCNKIQSVRYPILY